MERCDLTQVPCRKAISEENSTLSTEDFKRYFLIIKLFMIKDLRYLESLDAFANALTKE